MVRFGQIQSDAVRFGQIRSIARPFTNHAGDN